MARAGASINFQLLLFVCIDPLYSPDLYFQFSLGGNDGGSHCCHLASKRGQHLSASFACYIDRLSRSINSLRVAPTSLTEI